LFVPPGFDHAGFSEICQVLGNRHLRNLQNFLEVTHAQRTLLEKMEYSKPRLITQTPVNLKQVHNAITGIFSKKYMHVNNCFRRVIAVK